MRKLGGAPAASVRAVDPDAETRKCCRGNGDHEEWCYRRGWDSGPTTPSNPNPKLAKRIKRARREVRRRERVMLDARARILTEESERVIDPPARINNALAGVTNAVNAAMQTEAACRATWADNT